MSSDPSLRNVLVVDGCQLLPSDRLQTSVGPLLPFQCSFTCVPEYIEAFELLNGRTFNLMICVLQPLARESVGEERDSPATNRGHFTINAFLELTNTFQTPLPNIIFIVEDAYQANGLPLQDPRPRESESEHSLLQSQILVWTRETQHVMPAERLCDAILAGISKA